MLTKKAVEAINLTLGTTGKVDAKAAYETLLSGAGQGHPMSMNAVGKLLMEGIGCTANPEGLVFTDAKQGRRGHYDARGNVLWQFTQVQLQLLQEDTAAYIVGNLQMYSPQTMEPNQPMYLNLKKAGVTPHSQTKSRFYVYPNPFSEGINVSFFQQKEEKVSIQISAVNGKAVYRADLGKYPQGQQDITLTLNLQPGAYILRLTTGKTTQQSVIIRK